MDRQASWEPAPESGIKIEWIEAGELTFEVATAGEGEHLALCLHGFPELHYSWRHQMPLLAEMGYRVWAPNMRGYGGTTRPPDKKDYRLDKLTADVAALIDASGAKEVTLIAHDWGAIVAWQFAIQKVRPLARLVIMNVPHPLCARRELKTWKHNAAQLCTIPLVDNLIGRQLLLLIHAHIEPCILHIGEAALGDVQLRR